MKVENALKADPEHLLQNYPRGFAEHNATDHRWSG